MNQFRETFNYFMLYIEDFDYKTYWDWMLLDDGMKAAALYVDFYDTIVLAWSKTQKPFIEEDTAVSTVLQYLQKNVPVIKANKSRFTPNYMYKVAFNAFYPLGRIKRDINYYYNERESNYDLTDNGYNLDIDDRFDSDNAAYTECKYIEKAVSYDTYFDDEYSEIWAYIKSCDSDTQRIVDSLIYGKQLGKKLRAKLPEVITMLQIKLSEFNV